MGIRVLGLAVAATALAAGGATAALASTAAAAATGPAAAPRWHIVKSVSSGETGDFTAVVATSKTSAWGFDGADASGGPTAWRLTGSTWKKVAFPGKASEEVVAAAATSPSSVWAFANNVFGTSARALHWNGHAWSAVKSFPGQTTGAAVVSARDIWVFGYPASFGIPAFGVWHYNGHAWSHTTTSYEGGSALSARSVWAYKGTSVDHWNGTKWVAASVKRLLPATLPGHLNDPSVTGILALSATSVYAIGNGNDEDDGGPLAVLHYNGHAWSRVASGEFGFGAGQQLSADGSGGLWLPMPGADGAQSYLLHYSAGKLTRATLPQAGTRLEISSIARIPGTSDQLAGGVTHKANQPGVNSVAVLLKYN